MRQQILELLPPAQPTLEEFVPGRNVEAHAAVAALARAEGRERFVYVWGAPGCGRTHLLRAAVAKAGPGAAYLQDPALAGSLPGQALLAVDDLDALPEAGQGALFTLHNRIRDDPQGRLLCAGQAPPARLGLRADLATRLAAGLVFQIHTLSDEEKLLALVGRARGRGFLLPEEAAHHILSHSARDLGSLFVVLDAIDRYSLAALQPVTLSLVRRVLPRAASGPAPV